MFAKKARSKKQDDEGPPLQLEIPSAQYPSGAVSSNIRSATYRKTATSPKYAIHIEDAYDTEMKEMGKGLPPQPNNTIDQQEDVQQTTTVPTYQYQGSRMPTMNAHDMQLYQQYLAEQMAAYQQQLQETQLEAGVIQQKESKVWLVLEAIETERYKDPKLNRCVKRPYVSYIFYAICTIAFIAEIIYNGGFEPLSVNWAAGPSALSLYEMGGNAVLEARADFKKNWWRLFWNSYLHAGVFHLLMNLIAAWSVFPKTELFWGHAYAVAILIVTGFGGSLTSTSLQNKPIVSIGASGMIMGVCGAFVGDTIKNWRAIQYPGWQLLYWASSAIIMLLIGLIPQFDNLVHSGSFFVGICFSFLATPFRDKKQKLWVQVTYVTIATGLITAYFSAALVAIASGKPLDCAACCHIFATISCDYTPPETTSGSGPASLTFNQ